MSDLLSLGNYIHSDNSARCARIGLRRSGVGKEARRIFRTIAALMLFRNGLEASAANYSQTLQRQITGHCISDLIDLPVHHPPRFPLFCHSLLAHHIISKNVILFTHHCQYKISDWPVHAQPFKVLI
jgi:hypothetical protein